MIPNYNGTITKYKNKSILINCLNSIKKTTSRNIKIILIDDGSTDESVKQAAKYTNDIVQMPANTGNVSKVFNAGIIYAYKKYKPKYFILLNNDIIFINNWWLKDLLSVSETKSEIGIVGCKLIYPNGKIQHAGLIIGPTTYNRGRAEQHSNKYDLIEETDGVTFALALIKSKVIKKVGLFDQNFKMGYEDADYCCRAKKNGFKIIYDGKVKAIHLEGYTSDASSSKNQPNGSFYGSQFNSAYFAFKNFKGYDLLKSLLFILAASFITIEDKNRERKLLNIRIKSNFHKNFLDSISAIFNSMKKFDNT